jgi:basic amino acid/polyamine antiporter, APA family
VSSSTEHDKCPAQAGAATRAAVAPLTRAIGRWSLTALIINSIIGSGIFGVPGVLMATTGRASPVVMLVAGLLMAVILFCYAEVGSQFSEAGGVYLYARTAFGKFAGLQVGWFWLLSTLGGAGTNANLFVDHLGGFAPWLGQGWPRAIVLAALLLIPAAINYVGTRQGTLLSNGFTVAKLLPLVLLIVCGSIRFSQAPRLVSFQELMAPGWTGWVGGLLLLSFTYSGFEDSLATTGEVREPRRNIPLALVTAMGICIAVYTLLQWVVAATLTPGQTERPLAAVAQVLFGRGGAWFVELAAIISTYGWLSTFFLNTPRYLFAIAAHREFPAVFGRLHPRFGTPHIGVVVAAVLAWLLAVTGNFHWCLLLSAGASIVYYATVCAALLPLRRIRPAAPGFRLPFGFSFSLLGVAISLVCLTQLRMREALFMTITAFVAAANWWFIRRRAAATAPLS